MSRPIILDNAIMREGDNNKIFKYNYSSDMNYVFIDDKEILYLDIDTHLKELQTSTRVSREYDDDDISLLELSSKTEATRERDDEEISLLELSSKTKVARERDDEEISLLELMSKTFVERERDDEDSINFN